MSFFQSCGNCGCNPCNCNRSNFRYVSIRGATGPTGAAGPTGATEQVK